MNTIRQAFEAAQSREVRLKILATEGRKGVAAQNRELVGAYKQHRTGIWAFCVARALINSTHAKDAEGWYHAVAAFLRSGKREDLAGARGFSSSFGPDALQRALTSFRTLGEYTRLSAATNYTAAQLASAQETAVRYAMTESLSGLGAWLFCAPFELMAMVKPSLWESASLDLLLLPLGSALARGYGLLGRAEIVDVDEQLLRDSEPGIRNGLTLLYIARGCDEKIAREAGTRAIFCHHGIAGLGKVK